MNAIELHILSVCLTSCATPLTFSMEDIHICNIFCLRYVDDKKLSVFLSNVKCKPFKSQNYSKYLNSGSMACKVSIFY